ncbi:uncharacterized protein BDV14DRAFT_129431 [Aspergillus stella-maris]|uniref:uncharacterized protein n=1 Tax=Aspergillus stella-maris TaxID=1810926 RepID=UPI003CCE1460
MRMHPSMGLIMPRYVPTGGRVIAGSLYQQEQKWVSAHQCFTTTKISLDMMQISLTRPGGCETLKRQHRWTGICCIGKNVTLAEMHKMIPLLLREYSLEPSDPLKEWKTHNYWFNKQTGIHVKVTARQH